jgi:hypothetical protein
LEHSLTTPPLRSQVLCTVVVAVGVEEQEEQHLLIILVSLK